MKLQELYTDLFESYKQKEVEIAERNHLKIKSNSSTGRQSDRRRVSGAEWLIGGRGWQGSGRSGRRSGRVGRSSGRVSRLPGRHSSSSCTALTMHWLSSWQPLSTTTRGHCSRR